MALSASDVKFYYSMGSVSGSSGASNGDQSLGGTISTTTLAVGADQLFDLVTGEEAQAGDTSYRCIYVKNDGSQTAFNVVFKIQSDTTNAKTYIEIGKDPAGIGDGVNSGVATTISEEHTAPSGVTFGTSDIVIGDLDAGQAQAIWIKYVVEAGAPADDADNAFVSVDFETGA